MNSKKIILTILFVFLASFVSSAQNKKSWNEVAGSIEKEEKKIGSEVKSTAENIKASKKRLEKEKLLLKRTLKRKKIEAEKLRQRLISLKQKENRLKKELAGKEKTLNSIKSTITGTAQLLIKEKRLIDEDREKTDIFEDLLYNDTFPNQEKISLVLSSLLSRIEHSGSIIKQKKTIYKKDGTEINSEVLHIGGFQSFYKTDDTFGFAVKNHDLNTIETAAYIPDKNEENIIKNAFSGKDLIPLDLTSGNILSNPPEKTTWISSLLKGGIFIWPFMAIALISLLLIIERAYALFKIKSNGEIAVNNIDCTNPKTPSEHVVCTVREGKNLEQMENLLEESVLAQLPKIEKFLQTIKVFATISPLLGLLGTVSGIIKTFTVITAHGNGDPTLLSAGISEALVTTKLGLFLAIPLLLAHHILQKRANTIILHMEHAGAQIITKKAME